MKTRFCLLVCFFLFTIAAQAKDYRCEDLVSPEFKQISIFNSLKPQLESSLTTYNSNGSVKSEVTTSYLSSQSACKTNLDFKADCQVAERESNFGYEFSFNCKKQNLSGELYIDENGYGRFSCYGQIVTQFFECKSH